MSTSTSMEKRFATWFQVVSIILILFGFLYVFFGLKIFSDTIPLIPHDVLLQWESALYGAIMLGWGVTLVLVGKVAFRRNDQELKRALLLGLAVWLLVEAAASVWFGVWFNVGVDACVLILFGAPLAQAWKGEKPV
jgi:hypothetical protein